MASSTTLLLFGWICVSVSGTRLQSSVERACPGQNVTFTCTISSRAHRWEIPSLNITRNLVPAAGERVFQDHPFQIAVIDAGTPMKSTAIVTVNETLNGTIVFCQDVNSTQPLGSPDIHTQNNIVKLIVPDPLIVAGNSFPGVCPDWVALRWNQPTEARQCITNYHLDILTESGSRNMSVTGTVAAVNILSSECCLRHTFTVTPVYLLTGPRDTSDPVSFIPAQSGFPGPGTLQLNVVYDTAIRVHLAWENAPTLSVYPSYHITLCVDGQEQTSLSGSGSASTYDIVQSLEYGTYINWSVPISVNFSSSDCTSNSSISVTFPFVISGDPTVKAVGQNATILVIIAAIDLPTVTFDVVNTAVIDVAYWNTAQGDTGNPNHRRIMFPSEFPSVRTVQILINNLNFNTEYSYRIRVLTSNASTAVEIPRAVSGTFRSSPEVHNSTSPEPGPTTGGSVVTISIVFSSVISSSVISFFAGALLAASSTYHCMKHRKKTQKINHQVGTPSEECHQSGPLYAEVNVKPVPVTELEMKENIAYGPVGR